MEGCACFIVKDMMGLGMASSDKVGVEILIGCNVVCIEFGGKGADQDSVGAVKGHHDVLVAAAGTSMEVTSIISEYVGERDFVQLNHVGAKSRRAWW